MTDQQRRFRALLEFLLNQGSEMLHNVFGADSCIASTSIALRVLDYFDVGAFAKPVRTSLITALGLQLLQSDPEADLTGTTPGAYCCAIAGTGAVNGDRWDGHLVAIVPVGDELYLLDMTVGQFAHPEQGLNVPRACLVELPDDYDVFANSAASFGSSDGVAITYTILTEIDNGSWQDSGDWRDLVGGCRYLAGRIIQAFLDWEKGYDIEWDIRRGQGPRGLEGMYVGHKRGGLRSGTESATGIPQMAAVRENDPVPT